MSNITASATPMETQLDQLESLSLKLPALINQIIPSVRQIAQSIKSSTGFEKWLENIVKKSGYTGECDLQSQEFQVQFKNYIALKHKSQEITINRKRSAELRIELSRCTEKLQKVQRKSQQLSSKLFSLCEDEETSSAPDSTIQKIFGINIEPPFFTPVSFTVKPETVAPQGHPSVVTKPTDPAAKSPPAAFVRYSPTAYVPPLNSRLFCNNIKPESKKSRAKFTCDVPNCTARFEFLFPLKRHLKSAHQIKNPFAGYSHGCSWCGKMFKTRKAISTHHTKCDNPQKTRKNAIMHHGSLKEVYNEVEVRAKISRYCLGADNVEKE